MNSQRISKRIALAWPFYFVLTVLFASCGSQEKQIPLASHEALIMPVHLEPDSTWILLEDFHAWTGPVDSVVWENGTELTIQQHPLLSLPAVLITQQPTQAFGHLQLWSVDRSKAEAVAVPVASSAKRSVRVSLAISDSIQKASIIGGFTGWQSQPIPMEQEEDSLFVTLTLDEGSHLYQFVSDGKEFPDPANPNRMPNGFGGFNSILQAGSASEPLTLSTEYSDRFVCHTLPHSSYTVFWNNTCIHTGESDANGNFEFNMPVSAKHVERSHLRIWVANQSGIGQNELIPLQYDAPVRQGDLLTRKDRQAMIMYFLMVDRFKNGDSSNDWKSTDPGVLPDANHKGGDLRGIQNAISYLDSLGINTLWISPITPNPDDAWGFWSDPSTNVTSKFSGYHGYWPIASTGIDRRFGSMGAFHSLVDSIHANGMNILIDYVANHVHQEHPVYRAHPDWVTNLYLPDGSLNTQLWDSQRLTTWFDTFMPTLDLEREEVYETMTDSALWWIQNTNIDGFRHDATKHIPEVFWRRLTTKVRAATATSQRSVFQIGETYGTPSLIKKYLSSGMLDAQFDFNLYDAYVAAFTSEKPDLETLIAIAQQSIDAYGPHHLMGNISGNQDRPRFASLAEGSLNPGEDTKLAGWTRTIEHQGQQGYLRMGWLMASLMGQPGIPCIYYGDEIADAGGNDPDNRRMMRFGNWNASEKMLWDMTRDWIALRKSRMSLMYGQCHYHLNNKAPGVLAIERTYLDEKTLILINTSETVQFYPIPGDCNGSILLGDAVMEDGAISISPGSCGAIELQPNP